jgi:tetratricopeptide (TPR) repeat protein
LKEIESEYIYREERIEILNDSRIYKIRRDGTGIEIMDEDRIQDIQKVINNCLNKYQSTQELEHLEHGLGLALECAQKEGNKYDPSKNKFKLKKLILEEEKYKQKLIIKNEKEELINKEYNEISEQAQNILDNGKEICAKALELQIEYDKGEDSLEKEQQIKEFFLSAQKCFKKAKGLFVKSTNLGEEYKEAEKCLKEVGLIISGNHKYDEAIRLENKADQLREDAFSTQNQEKEKESNEKYTLCLKYYNQALSLYQEVTNSGGVAIFQERIDNIKKFIEEVSEELSNGSILETTESTYHIPVAVGSNNNENNSAQEIDINILGNSDHSIEHTYELI